MTGQDDACNHFHPNGFAIVKHENHVDVAWALHCHKKSKTVNKAYPFRPTFTMADAGASMSSALQEVYSDVPRGTCYFHVLENVKSYFGAVSKDHDRFSIKNEFLDDVKFIHVAWTIPVKIKAIELFLLKWRTKAQNDEWLKAIVNVFTNSWILKNNKWCNSDMVESFPLNNNGLESCNKLIKSECTHHKELEIIPLFEGMREWLSSKSKERNPKLEDTYVKPFYTEPQPTGKEWQRSYFECTSTAKKYKMRRLGNIAISLNQRSGIQLTKKTYTEIAEQFITCSWQTFDHYKSYCTKVNVLTKTDGKWRCSCYFFGRNNYCSHEHSARWRYDGKEQGIAIPKEYRFNTVNTDDLKGPGRPKLPKKNAVALPLVLQDSDDDSDDFDDSTWNN